MAKEVHFSPFGIPYIVEFANVSFRPDAKAASSSDPDVGPSSAFQGLKRSNTTASEPPSRNHKPLPSIPLPTRSNSLRFFRPKPAAPAADEQDGPEDFAHIRPLTHRATISPLRTRRRAVYITTETSFAHSTTSIPPPSPVRAVDSQATLVAHPALEPVLEHDPESDFIVITPLPEPVCASAPEPRPRSPEKPSGGLFIQLALPPDDRDAKKPSLYRLRKKIADAVVEAGMHAPDQQAPAAPAHGSRPAGDGKTGDLFRGTYGQVLAAFNKAELRTTPCGEDGFEEGAYFFCSSESGADVCGLGTAKRLGALFVANRDGNGGVVFKKVVLWG
ncbi:hypothetical protein EWM64_g2010 [Hericium alpestre]|uniref:Uncharacterized protein n=1 Tax=Hericium alpestre TaxID=135208 RepID=A0A4Z0A4P1_9AGAM|nr:hypothetical protein EWM64_g2010 [Hericium alpestre]